MRVLTHLIINALLKGAKEMTKKEKKYIAEKIEQYQKWANEDFEQYYKTGDKEYLKKYELNLTAMLTIKNLMMELEYAGQK